MGAEPLQIRFEELYEHAGWVRALARSLVADSGVAEDLVQETWLAAVRRPPTDRRNLRGWLGRVVTNAARQRHRREAGRAAAAEAPQPSSSDETPEALVAAVEGHRELAELVLALDEPYRSTVILRYWHGLDSAQIARRQRAPAGTVRWRLKEGLDRLRARLDERHGGDRRAWCLALLPLARQGAAPAGAAALPAVLQGVLGMHLALKLTFSAAALALAVLALVATGVVDLDLRGPLRSPEVARAAAPSTEPEREEAEVGAASLDTVRRAAAPREVDPSLPSVPPSAPQLARVEARAVDLEGYPIDGATLRTDSAWGEPAESDASGALVLELDPHGPERGLDFIALAPGHAAAKAQGVARRGETLHLGDIVLGPGGEVVGRVLDQDGLPIQGARVAHVDPRLPVGGVERARLEASFHGSAWMSVTSDAEGAFLLPGVPARRVRIQAAAADRLAAISAPLDVPAGGRVEGLELVLEPLPRDDVIAGQVVDPDGAPVPYASVRLEYRSWFSSGSHSTTTDGEGRFEVLCQSDHARRLHARDNDGRWSDAVIEKVRPGSVDLVVRLGEPIPLVVDVRGEGGARLEQVELVLWDPPRHNYFQTSVARTEQGTWELGAPGERFVVVASAPGHEERELGPFDPADLPELVECTLGTLPGVRGLVLADGAPVAGASVEIVEEEREWAEKNGYPVRVGSWSAHGSSDDAGRFAITLRRSGRFFVRIEAEGWAPRELGPVTIAPRTGLDLGQIELTPGGAIEGSVVVEPGASPAGTVVSIARGDGHARTQRVGPDGRFRFDHLIPGPWQVELRDEELDPDATSWSSDSFRRSAPIPSNCTVVEGRTTRFDLSPADLALCELEGTLVVDGAPAQGWLVTLVEAETSPISSDDLREEIGADGAFHVARALPGRYRLLLTAEDGLGLVAEVELVEGGTSWSAELATATLDVEGLAPPLDERIPAALYLWERDGLLAAVQVFAGEDGTARGLRIPAGRGRLVRVEPLAGVDDPRQLPTLAEVDATAGETALVRLP